MTKSYERFKRFLQTNFEKRQKICINYSVESREVKTSINVIRRKLYNFQYVIILSKLLKYIFSFFNLKESNNK